MTKKPLMVLAWLLFFGVALKAHGGHLAIYTYAVSTDQIQLEFKIEKAILDHFDMSTTCETYETATAFCVAQYINANTSLSIAGEDVQFELQQAQQDGAYFTLKMVAKGDFSDRDPSMSIENHCFLEFDRTFEHRIIVEKAGEIKSYRLNRKHPIVYIN